MAKVYAKVMPPHRETSTSSPEFTLQYVFLVGEKRSDQVSIIPGPVSGDGQLKMKLRQGLVAHLSVKYAPEMFRLGDVVVG